MNRTSALCRLSSLLLLISSCAVVDNHGEGTFKDSAIISPAFPASLDSIKMRKVKSLIQSSPEHILPRYSTYKDGKFVLIISSDEMKQLGITEDLCSEYQKILDKLNQNQ